MVIGGGGGLHQPLKMGKDILPELATDYKPLFHYLTVKREEGGLKLTSYRIDEKFKDFEEGFRMAIEVKELKQEVVRN
jgi:hypothetical protein